MAKIKSIIAREILDSRGNPTVEVICETDDGYFVDGVPSGASTGANEALELRDGDSFRYQGKGVLKAVDNVNNIIAPKVIGMDPVNQKEIDDVMLALDGTENKGNLGANAILGVSMSVCRAGAKAKNVPLYRHVADLAGNTNELFLPRGGFNIVNGGAHAGTKLDFQEFMIMPNTGSFRENLRVASETYHLLKEFIKEGYSSAAVNVGDEGGFAPPIELPDIVLASIMKSVEDQPNLKFDIVMDVAASQFYKDGIYVTNMGAFNSEELLSYYEMLMKQYPIIAIEDPFAENDWFGFQEITARHGENLIIIGDDLLVTNPKIIKEAKEKNACNNSLLKINQIGSISETIEAANLAKSYGWTRMVSHRSGETIDDFIADFVVGIGGEFIKSGAPARGERLAKYNRLMKIEEELNNN
ncbi:MAG: phosphopyruvate hydratase [Minisyncoccus archaeiphilus]|uniref:phosphopyruvate hydratase n=1 Tax=Minisyncoccus archaeiphilus TaxID=3238481 RepID=UPI0009C5C21D|nr:MAG: Enolase [Parcubacteria group bacterium ADurb.Bin216]GMX59891.1 MAG: phosphopyruvate hydratase [Candidatus Parcubacteria bacterium]